MEHLLISALTLGFTIGLLHALDPDHVVAMGTIVSRERSIRRSSLLGAIWGLGHTTSLALVGLIVLVLQFTIPPPLSKGMELGVALMIMLLGGQLIWQSARGCVLHGHTHTHNRSIHAHVHIHNRTDVESHHHHRPRSGKQSFAIGIIHGLAGSAAVTLAVMTTMTSTLQGFLYIVVFGLGSIGGMLIMSTLMSVPFSMLAHRLTTWQKPAQGLVGVLAVSFGMYFAWSVTMTA